MPFDALAATQRIHQRRGEPERIAMRFQHTEAAADYLARIHAFMDQHIFPSETEIAKAAHSQPDDFHQWRPISLLEVLKGKAQEAGLWNLFLPDSEHGAGLTNTDYAPLAEAMGRVSWAPEIFNCSAPDTGNMEVLARYGTPAQQDEWLRPLLKGTIRSAFAMTEPDVASSDATNIRTRIVRDGESYVINGTKWWISGAGDPRCRLLIVMGQSDPENANRHQRQSMILVPRDAPGVTVRRYLPVIGLSDAPHGHMELVFDDVRVPAENILLGEGRGFEIAEGRLGPGRIHHCMRLIGLSERVLARTCQRLSARTTFGAAVSDSGLWRWRIAQARCAIEQARLLTMKAAWLMDTVGNKAARAEIAMIKIVAPKMAHDIVDMAMQAFGGGGFADGMLAHAFATARTLRVADGPDEVHAMQLARLELGRHGRDDEAASVGVRQGVDVLQSAT